VNVIDREDKEKTLHTLEKKRRKEEEKKREERREKKKRRGWEGGTPVLRVSGESGSRFTARCTYGDSCS